MFIKTVKYIYAITLQFLTFWVEYTFVRPRYILGGGRPSQTTHQKFLDIIKFLI